MTEANREVDQVGLDPSVAPSRSVPRVSLIGRCPMCGAAESALLFVARDRAYAVPGEFTCRRCRDCRTIYQDPRASPVDRWFERLSRGLAGCDLALGEEIIVTLQKTA